MPLTPRQRAIFASMAKRGMKKKGWKPNRGPGSARARLAQQRNLRKRAAAKALNARNKALSGWGPSS